MDVSIILRTKNEGNFIGQTLNLLLSQVYPTTPKIILVDSGSSDDTLMIAAMYPQVEILKIPSDDFSYGRALNFGIAAAEGEIAVALSAHAFPCDAFWLQRLLNHFKNPKVAGVYGRQVPHDDAWPCVKRDYAEFYGEMPRIQTDPNDVRDHCFSNAASAVRKRCWQEYKFDETLPYCEDWDWARAMLRLGHQVVYDPSATVFHSHNEAYRMVYHRCYNEALGRSILYSRERPLSWFQEWVRSVIQDIRYICQTRASKRWLARAVVYRLFWSLGRSLRPARGRSSLVSF